jgi:SAM-dependent methyltransferase
MTTTLPNGRVQYTDRFFDYQLDATRSSAEAVVPLVLNLVQPGSVVDFGCGTGVWLAEFVANGIGDVLGIDGDYVSREQLQIPAHTFRALDLAREIELGREFDLCVSLEVAEHLPPDAAATFVRTLTAAAPVVLFSAAVPLQGGDHHVNEQWPSYWASLFRARGYLVIDAIRPQVWSDERVQWYYSQNILVLCREDELLRRPLLQVHHSRTDHARLDLVHPRHYSVKAEFAEASVPRDSVRALVRALPGALTAAIRRRQR